MPGCIQQCTSYISPLLVLFSSIRKNIYNHRVKFRLTIYDMPKMGGRGHGTEMLMPVSPKHYHLGFVKTFPKLSGTESGPITCLASVWDSLLLFNTLNTKQRGFCFFYFLSSFYQPLSPPAYRACMCPLSYTFSSTLYPHSSQITGEVLPCSERLWHAPVLYKTVISKIVNS